MVRIGLALVAAFALMSIAGCQREDTSISEKLEQIDEHLTSIEKKIDEGGGAPAGRARKAPPRRRRPRPQPNEVYAANIEGAPCVGPKNAKVTLVEAFDFA